MKNILFLLLFVVLYFSFSQSVWAEEIEFDYSKIRGVSVGGAGFIEISRAGGFGEIGYTVYSKNKFDIRNYVRLGGSASDKGSLFFTLTKRVSFGGVKPITTSFALRRYGLLDLSFSCFKKGGKDFFTNPYIIDIRVGSGMEFLAGRGAYFIEIAFGYSFITEGSMKNALDMNAINGAITLGGRGYF